MSSEIETTSNRPMVRTSCSLQTMSNWRPRPFQTRCYTATKGTMWWDEIERRSIPRLQSSVFEFESERQKRLGAFQCSVEILEWRGQSFEDQRHTAEKRWAQVCRSEANTEEGGMISTVQTARDETTCRFQLKWLLFFVYFFEYTIISTAKWTLSDCSQEWCRHKTSLKRSFMDSPIVCERGIYRSRTVHPRQRT